MTHSGHFTGRREFASLQADFAERQHLVRQGSVDKRAADALNNRVARIPADPAAVVVDPAAEIATRARLAVRRCAEGAEEVAGRVARLGHENRAIKTVQA